MSDHHPLPEIETRLPPSRFPEYCKEFREYVEDQGYIHIDLNCYKFEIREAWLESKSFSLLFIELFEGEKNEENTSNANP